MSNNNPLGKLMEQAQQMQRNIQKAQQELANLQVTGKAGIAPKDVTILMTGRYDVRRVGLGAELLQESKEIIEDLIAAAINDAVRKIEDGSRGKMSGLMSGLDLPPGFQMPTDVPPTGN